MHLFPETRVLLEAARLYATNSKNYHLAREIDNLIETYSLPKLERPLTRTAPPSVVPLARLRRRTIAPQIPPHTDIAEPCEASANLEL